MGQTQSLAENILPTSVDAVHMEMVRHAKVLSEINALTYENFGACVQNLNSLSRRCIAPNGKQLVFLVKKGTDTSLLWKATVKIACVEVDPITREMDNQKLLNLKQFLCVFKTFQAHLDSLVSSENQRSLSGRSTPTNPMTPTCNRILMDEINALVGNGRFDTTDALLPSGHSEECSICLDRRMEVILPCTHSFCTPCIEQWNVNNKTCPICSEALNSTDETWVMSDIPGVEEINEKICSEFMSLAKNVK